MPLTSWLTRAGVVTRAEGDFLETRVIPQPPTLHTSGDFLGTLAGLLMARYESAPAPQLLSLRTAQPAPPTRTRRYYRRLFDTSGQPTADFVSYAAEVVGRWFEDADPAVLATEGDRPHGTEPALDVLSLLDLGNDRIGIRLVQVKASDGNAQANCSLALRKFRRLEAGDYDAELMDLLTLMERSGVLPAGCTPSGLLFGPDKHYRVTPIHSEDLQGTRCLTQFDAYIPGPRTRRSAFFLRISPWKEFWEELGRRVYAQLG